MIARLRRATARTDLVVGGALWLVCWLLFVANCRVIATNDSLATALVPFALWSGEGMVLDTYVREERGEPLYCFARDRQGHWRNTYPPGTALIAAPLYFPLLWSEDSDPLEPSWPPLARVAEKYAAATLAATAVVLLFALLRRSLDWCGAGFGALAFALATPIWSVASQALWQHGPAALALLVGLHLLLAERPSVWTGGGAGLAAALLVAVRPPDAILAAALAGLALRRPARTVAVPFLALAVAGGAALFAYNLGHFGNLVGGYSTFHLEYGFTWQRLLGLLVSNQGLLVYCPFLVFLLRPGSLPRGVDAGDAGILALSWLATLALYASLVAWWGGENFGARYLIDGLPILFLLGGGAWARSRFTLRRLALLAAVGVAVGIQAVGAFYFPAGESRRVANTEPRFASFRRSLPYLAFEGGAPPPELAPLAGAAGTGGDRGQIEARLDFAPRPPRYWMIGGRHPVEFEIENRGARRLAASGSWGGWGATRLLVLWRALETPHWEASELGLRGDLEAGERRHVVHQLIAPIVAGRYRLEAVVIEKGESGGRELARAEALEVVVGPELGPRPDPAVTFFADDFESGDLASWSDR